MADTSDEISALPHVGWVVAFLALWLILALLPLGLVYLGEHGHLVADANAAAVAGTIGDALGLANSVFSAAAFLLVVWSLRLQHREIQSARREAGEAAKAQADQIALMAHTAELTAINHIYAHYGLGYGQGDSTGILASIAAGHRRWAIRRSFGAVDSKFDAERTDQVLADIRGLIERLRIPVSTDKYLKEVASRVSSLLVEHRAPENLRKALWPLYELLRESPGALTSDGDAFEAFRRFASMVVAASEGSPKSS